MKPVVLQHQKKTTGIHIDPTLEKKYKESKGFSEKLDKANKDLANSNFTNFIKKEGI